MSLLGASCNQDVSSYPGPEPGTGYAAKTALIIAKNSAGSGLFRWPPRGRCSAEALVTPRMLPCQGLIDVSGGVRVSEAASPSRRLACADTRSCQLITEPWGTPQRATPKSCCPCPKKKLKNSQKFKNTSKTTEKNNPRIPKRIPKNKNARNNRKNGTNSTKKTYKNQYFKKGKNERKNEKQ